MAAKRRTSQLALMVALALLFVWIPFPQRGRAQPQGFTGVLTWHNDNLRTGQNTNEATLTPSDVNSKQFGKLFSYQVNGQIYAQPLYVPNVNIPGRGILNVVYVATEEDQVYVFDADANQPVLWQDSFINPAGGITAAQCMASTCSICPAVGITGTPVIDPTSNTMYLVSRTVDNGTYVTELHALDITTGVEKFGGPTSITASSQGVTFEAMHQGQRAGLLLVNGVVYIGFSGAVHGWILGYNAQTLAQVAVFCVQPKVDAGHPGSIWQSGAGLSADSLGYIYAVSGDGLFDANTGGSDYGDTMLKLFPGTNGLSVVDYFTPDNQAMLLIRDLDFGSTGALLLPTQPGKHPDEAIGAAKDGKIYLIDRDHMGGYNANSNHVIQSVPTKALPAFWGMAAFWNENLYFGARGDFLRMYTLTNGLLSTISVSRSPTSYQFPGPTPSVSANGTTNGIVWAIERDDNLVDLCQVSTPAVLHAYNAANLSEELYNTTQAGSRDQLGPATKFGPPTIANGKVYIGTETELDVLGLLP